MQSICRAILLFGLGLVVYPPLVLVSSQLSSSVEDHYYFVNLASLSYTSIVWGTNATALTTLRQTCCSFTVVFVRLGVKRAVVSL